MSARGGGALFLDTILSRDSWAAVLGGTGAVLAAVDHAWEARATPLPRSGRPGHHALAARGMGFCLVNNVVVAARHAQASRRQRVLIVDWDVHHGNGTQALVETDPTMRYVSLHQYPWYPGTGAADERGVGNIFNVPRGPGKPPELYVGDLWAAIVAATSELDSRPAAGLGRIRCHGRRPARRIYPGAGALPRPHHAPAGAVAGGADRRDRSRAATVPSGWPRGLRLTCAGSDGLFSLHASRIIQPVRRRLLSELEEALPQALRMDVEVLELRTKHPFIIARGGPERPSHGLGPADRR